MAITTTMSFRAEAKNLAEAKRKTHLRKNMNTYYVYIMSNKRNTVLYVGVTNDIERRVAEHKNHLLPGFTARYNVDKCVYVEDCGSIEDAIAREKQLKGWSRAKKFDLIAKFNPDMKDLSEE